MVPLVHHGFINFFFVADLDVLKPKLDILQNEEAVLDDKNSPSTYNIVFSEGMIF